MRKIKKTPALVIAIAFLFVLGISFAGYLGARKSAHADDNEQEMESGDGNQANVGQQENDNEDGSQPTNNEDGKSATSNMNNTNHENENGNGSKSSANKNGSEKENESENKNGNSSSSNSNSGSATVSGAVQDLAQQVVVLDKEVAQAEAQINTISATGGDATAYTASLNNVKSLVSQIQSDITANNTAGAQTLVQQAHEQIGNLKDSLGSALGDAEENDNGAGDTAENENENQNQSANANQNANASQNANQNNKAVAAEDNNSSDQPVVKQYKNTVAQFVHNLQTVASQNTGNGIGQQVSAIAKAQDDSQAKVAAALDDAGSRGGFMTFLIGPKYGDLSTVKNEITANQTQIQSLNQVMGQLQDQNSKSVIQDQINALQNQNNSLQQFVSSNENKVSIFGWLVKLFS